VLASSSSLHDFCKQPARRLAQTELTQPAHKAKRSRVLENEAVLAIEPLARVVFDAVHNINDPDDAAGFSELSKAEEDPGYTALSARRIV
jgi:hypothetical protein